MGEELSDETRSIREGKVQKFLCTFLGSHPEEAVEYLERFNWDLDKAAASFIDKSLDRWSDVVESPKSDRSARGKSIVADSSPTQPPIPPRLSLKMADPVEDLERSSRKKKLEQFCKTLEIAPSVGFEILERYNWNLEIAFDKYFKETEMVESPSIDISARGTSSTPPIATGSSPTSSTQPPNPQQELQPLSNDQRIVQFLEIATGSTVHDATNYLERCDWDVHSAVGYWVDKRVPPPLPPIGPSRGAPETLASFTVDDVAPHIRSIGGSLSPSQFYAKQQQAASSPGLVDDEIKDAGEEDIPPMDSDQLRRATWPDMTLWVDKICDDCGVSRAEALFYLEVSQWDFDVGMQACRNKTSLAPVWTASFPGREESTAAPMVVNSLKQHSQLQAEIVKSVCEVTGVTTVEANDHLDSCNWNAKQAINCLLNKSQEEETWRGVPSQLQRQGSHGSSSRSIDAETGSSHFEAGEESVTVAIPGIVPSQVDENVKGNVVGEDAEMKTFDIELADAETVLIPFSLNETVRDIHNRIGDVLRPDENRDYYLVSKPDGEEYKDLDITVQKIVKRKCLTLLQVYYEDN